MQNGSHKSGLLCALTLAGALILQAGCGPTGITTEGEETAPPVIDAEVTVQSSEQSSETAGEGQPSPTDDPAAALKAALEAKDYATIETLMAPDFGFGLIASEGTVYTPAGFIEQLRTSYLEPGDVVVNLDRDVAGEVSPDYRSLVESYAQALYSNGWGEAGSDTALLFLNEQGQWSGMLYMFEGLEEELGVFGGEGQVAEGVEEAPPPPGDSTIEEEVPASLEGINTSALGPFQDTLLDSITDKRNYALLQALMGEKFVIGYWRSEGVELDPAEARAELENNLLPPEAFVSYTLTGDLSGMLDGQDPLNMWGPGVNAVSAIHSTGWGSEGDDEVILIIARREDQTYYWYGLLYALGGF